MNQQSQLRVSHNGLPIRASVSITGSKSISNRLLIIKALGQLDSDLTNISASADTQTLIRLLATDCDKLDAHHAGTTFRFLTAYLSLKSGEQILTGSERMQNRPIKPLVAALRHIGADINYLGKKGYPPLSIGTIKKQKNKRIEINATVSSQFISALCLIAPYLPEGLEIHLIGEQVSRPYVDMTLSLMDDFGIKIKTESDLIIIQPGTYLERDYHIESDWSSASYYYAIAAISGDAEINLSSYFRPSLQGDSILSKMFNKLGVITYFGDDNQVRLRSEEREQSKEELILDFLTCPDLAQTIATVCAAKGIVLHLTGVQTLLIKETDRITALTNELSKVGVQLSHDISGRFEYTQQGKFEAINPSFETYDDHRMAMSLAPLGIITPITITNPKVVEKSYPGFWDDIASLGFELE